MKFRKCIACRSFKSTFIKGPSGIKVCGTCASKLELIVKKLKEIK